MIPDGIGARTAHAAPPEPAPAHDTSTPATARNTADDDQRHGECVATPPPIANRQAFVLSQNNAPPAPPPAAPAHKDSGVLGWLGSKYHAATKTLTDGAGDALHWGEQKAESAADGLRRGTSEVLHVVDSHLPAPVKSVLSNAGDGLVAMQRGVDAAKEKVGTAIDSAVHVGEKKVDEGRAWLSEHGGVPGKIAAAQIGFSEGGVLAIYGMGKGLVQMADGAAALQNPLEWAANPGANIDRLKTTSSSVATIGKLASPLGWALDPGGNAATVRNLWDSGVKSFQSDPAKFIGNAVTTVATVVVPFAGEASLAGDAARAGEVAGDVADAAKAADVAKAADAAEAADAAKAADAATAADAAKAGDTAEAAAPKAIEDAAAVAARDTKLNIDHVLDGEINAKGKAVGYHYRPHGVDAPNARMTQLIEPADANGVYKGRVEIRNSDGTWVQKKTPSTFYPDNMSSGEIDTAIRNAYKDALRRGEVNPTNGHFVGDSGRGFQIEGYVRDGEYKTAYPIHTVDK